jgi:hypothetical protein
MTPRNRHSVGTSVWTGFALGPLAWGASQQTSYVLATTHCGVGQTSLILAVNAVALVLALIGFGLCWRGWRMLEGSHETGSARSERSFTAVTGMLLSLMFAAVILAQGLANLFLGGCRA